MAWIGKKEVGVIPKIRHATKRCIPGLVLSWVDDTGKEEEFAFDTEEVLTLCTELDNINFIGETREFLLSHRTLTLPETIKDEDTIIWLTYHGKEVFLKIRPLHDGDKFIIPKYYHSVTGVTA